MHSDLSGIKVKSVHTESARFLVAGRAARATHDQQLLRLKSADWHELKVLVLSQFLGPSVQTRWPERPLYALSNCVTVIMPPHMHVGQTRACKVMKTRR